MPRRKRKKTLPEIIDFIDEDGAPASMELINEKTESYGAGASKKIQSLENYNKAMEHIANKVFFDDSENVRKRFKKIIEKRVSIYGVCIELERIGIPLGDRAMRNLARQIKAHIQAFTYALKKRGGIGTF
jgi:hypothetical protein